MTFTGVCCCLNFKRFLAYQRKHTVAQEAYLKALDLIVFLLTFLLIYCNSCLKDHLLPWTPAIAPDLVTELQVKNRCPRVSAVCWHKWRFLGFTFRFVPFLPQSKTPFDSQCINKGMSRHNSRVQNFPEVIYSSASLSELMIQLIDRNFASFDTPFNGLILSRPPHCSKASCLVLTNFLQSPGARVIWRSCSMPFSLL